jgi:ankyrin repeat protein
MAEVGDLFAAIQKGDTARVAAILDAEPGLASARRQGAPALLIARYHGRHDIVALLRARLSALDVFEAAALGDIARLTALLDADPDLVNAVAEDGFGPLGLASFFDHEPAVRLLLARGAQVAQASANAMRVMPLHSAAAARSVPLARLLLGQMELIELLLRYGANPVIQDADGRSAADHARSRGHEDDARRLARG